MEPNFYSSVAFVGLDGNDVIVVGGVGGVVRCPGFL